MGMPPVGAMPGCGMQMNTGNTLPDLETMDHYAGWGDTDRSFVGKVEYAVDGIADTQAVFGAQLIKELQQMIAQLTALMQAQSGYVNMDSPPQHGVGDDNLTPPSSTDGTDNVDPIGDTPGPLATGDTPASTTGGGGTTGTSGSTTGSAGSTTGTSTKPKPAALPTRHVSHYAECGKDYYFIAGSKHEYHSEKEVKAALGTKYKLVFDKVKTAKDVTVYDLGGGNYVINGRHLNSTELKALQAKHRDGKNIVVTPASALMKQEYRRSLTDAHGDLTSTLGSEIDRLLGSDATVRAAMASYRSTGGHDESVIAKLTAALSKDAAVTKAIDALHAAQREHGVAETPKSSLISFTTVKPLFAQFIGTQKAPAAPAPSGGGGGKPPKVL